ncbi:fhaB [Symbiodinium natans]|uniref:FhaB protein n=1 Tax=Symbiodinium natans TaxID=878477 RepID=A0A812RHD6_9DINO|nr:fhaB [Symbiodinium natans]
MIKLGETEMQVLSQSPSPRGTELSVMFYEGPFAGHKVTVPAAGITIGRVSDNTLVLLQDGTVSAHHAMLFHENSNFFIQDLGSCNGTCVRLSEERISSDWHPIMDGDVPDLAGIWRASSPLKPSIAVTSFGLMWIKLRMLVRLREDSE